MDNYCAPQWVDFTSSPQIPSDDYFEQCHDIYESQLFAKVIKQNIKLMRVSEMNGTPKKSVHLQNGDFIKPMPNITDNLETEIDNLKNTPIKVTCPLSHNSNKHKVVKQMSYDNVLIEAMENVQLCENLCNTKKDTDAPSTEHIFKKPKPVKSNTSKPLRIREMNDIYSPISTGRQIQNIVKGLPAGETKNISSSSINTIKPDKNMPMKDIKSIVKTPQIDDPLKYNKQNTLKDDPSKKKSDNQNLKLKSSTIKNQSSVTKTDLTTKINKSNRSTVTLNQSEQEKSKVKKVEKDQTKTKFIRPNSVDSGVTLRKKTASKNSGVTNADNTAKVNQTPKSCSSFSKQVRASGQKSAASRRTVSSIVNITGSEITVKKEKILFFDIPVRKQKKITCPVPFSFENRDKIKKELKANQAKPEYIKSKSVPDIKLLLNKISCKLPDSKKRMVTSSSSSRGISEQNKKVSIYRVHPLIKSKSMETVDAPKDKIERKKILDTQNKKEVNQIKKPLMPVSCKNISLNTNLKIKKKEMPEVNTKSIKKENRTPNTNLAATNGSNLTQKKEIKSKDAVVKRNVDYREKQRRELEERMKQKKLLQEEKLKREKEERLAKEKLEIAKLRKQAEIKARPMPVYKPLIHIKSTKPLTKPESPAWSSKKRITQSTS